MDNTSSTPTPLVALAALQVAEVLINEGHWMEGWCLAQACYDKLSEENAQDTTIDWEFLSGIVWQDHKSE